jgi:hypothetical protein
MFLMAVDTAELAEFLPPSFPQVGLGMVCGRKRDFYIHFCEIIFPNVSCQLSLEMHL